MGYKNIGADARIFVQTGMNTKAENAERNAQSLSNALGGASTGYIHNGSEGLGGDVGEYLKNSLGAKDVVTEYTYRVINAQGPSLIVMHSAGNADGKKALQAGSLHGHKYENLSFLSLGSPVSGGDIEESVSAAGARYLGQVNDWRDPVTYSKLFLMSVGASAAAGAGQSVLAGASSGPLGVIGGLAVMGLLSAGKYGVENYHPFEQYIAQSESRSLMFDWLRTKGQRR